MSIHTADLPLAGSIESSLRQAVAVGLIADADLATSAVAVKAAILAKKVHVSLLPLKYAAIRLIDVLATLPGGANLITGGSVASVLAAVPGNWGTGFNVGL